MLCVHMLGFVPGYSVKDYNIHSQKLLAHSKDAHIQQVCNWWQTPECWYAFESKEGAIWWGRNGGPQQYCQELSTLLPKRKCNHVKHPSISAKCFFCEKSLFDHNRISKMTIMSCSCSTWHLHNTCRQKFSLPHCFKCNCKYSDTLVNETEISIVASVAKM